MKAFKKIVVVMALLAINMSVGTSAGSRKWKDILEKIDYLQANPLAPDAKETSASVVKWLINSKEVPVTLCADLTVGLTAKGDQVGGTLAVHSLLGAAKYAMTTPPAQQSKFQMYMASMNGALDAYQKVVSSDSTSRRKTVDEVVEQRKAGKLEEYVKKQSEKCDQ